MTASLGASVLVILTFFTALSTMLVLAVHIESTLQHPRRHRRQFRVSTGAHAARPDSSSSRRARSRI